MIDLGHPDFLAEIGGDCGFSNNNVTVRIDFNINYLSANCCNRTGIQYTCTWKNFCNYMI